MIFLGLVGGFSSLRVLTVTRCLVKRILCSCEIGYNDQLQCYRRKPSRGCMSGL